MNIFLTKLSTPYDSIPFDQIKFSDYEEAVKEGIRIHDDEINAIIINQDVPDYGNTIEALEMSGEILDNVSSVLFNLISAETNDELDGLSEKLSPVLSEHSNKILHNPSLFERVRYVYDYYNQHRSAYEELTVEQRTLLKNTYDSFVRHGAALSTADKKKFADLSKDLSILEIKFSQNHLKELNGYNLHITDVHLIPGLPDTLMSIAAEEAKKRNTDGWVFTLHAPSYIPFITYCENRSLREQMYLAYSTLCTHGDHNNFQIVHDIVNKKRELAQLLGYTDYAEYVLTKRMAENKKNVFDLLDHLANAYMPYAIEETEQIKQLACEDNGPDFQLMPWDFPFYANKLKEKHYQINSEMVRPYLELEKVKMGVFGLAGRLYGLKFQKIDNVAVYHPDVEVYKVTDKDGIYIALLYCDFFPRPTKKSGAWMTSFKEQWIDGKGVNSRPHVSINMNFPRPTQEKPSLLSLGELETFLHEFGHALHGILSNTKYKSLNGTNVYWDFVELPSQFMENFAYEASFLNEIASHYQTGEKLPAEMLEKIIKSKNFNVAYACIRQISFGLLDMSYYSLKDSFDKDIISWEKNVFDKYRLLPYVEGACMTVQFAHIMAGGYSAGYYSYKWAEVLDADAFAYFKEHGLYDTAVAEKFKINVLSKGGTEHPMVLYKRFRGKAPEIDPLLIRNGIKTNR